MYHILRRKGEAERLYDGAATEDEAARTAVKQWEDANSTYYQYQDRSCMEYRKSGLGCVCHPLVPDMIAPVQWHGALKRVE